MNTCAICRYVYNLGRWIDQGLNALTGGDPRQTVSSRLGRAEQSGKAWAIWFCRVLSKVFRDPNHCVNAIIADDNAMEVVDIDGPGR